MITLQNVSKKYKNAGEELALNNINTTFEKGLIHGIIGVSGAGKSTLIRLLNKLDTPTDGTIDVFEYTNVRELNKESTRMLRRRIGMIFQSDHLLSRKTVLENILLPITFHRNVTEDDILYAKSLINEAGLTDYTNRYPNQLSGGQRQRVGIARALINKPELLLCDEPTSALDVITTANILHLIKKMASNHAVNVIIVTHDMNVIREICDTVTVMEKGEIVEKGYIDDILFKATHPQTKAFIKEIGLDLSLYTSVFNKEELLLLFFDDDIVKDAIISTMTQSLQVTTSILYASITPNRKGIMLLHVPKNIKEVSSYLTQKQVVVEHVV